MYATVSTIGVVAGVVLLAGYFAYRAALPKPIPGIPYNEEASQRIMGDLPDFLQFAKDDQPAIFTWVAGQCVKMNSPIIQLFIRPFTKPWVVIADFQEAQDIMAHRSREFDRSNFFGDLLVTILPYHHVHMKTGPEWKQHRRLVGDTMSANFLNSVVAPQLYNTALDGMELWKEKMRLAEGRPFEAMQDISRGALDIIWAASFGSEIGTQKSQLVALSKLDKIDLPKSVDEAAKFPLTPTPAAFDSIMTLTQSSEIAVNSPFPRQHHWFALRFYPSLRSAKKHKDALIQSRLDEAWKKFATRDEDDSKVTSAMDLIVQREVQVAKKEGRKPEYDSLEISDELFGFLVAGHDTTATTTSWGLKFLTNNQDAQNKLRAALRETHSRAYAAGETPTVGEITKASVPYLDAVIEEMSRKANTASANMRVALQDTQVLGHFIPKGTDVFMLNCGPGYIQPSLKVDDRMRTKGSEDIKERFGAWDETDISAFKPERWLKNVRGELQFDPHAGPMHGFGAGPRACFGRKLAYLEMKIILTLIFWKFELQPTPEELSSMRGHIKLTHEPIQCYVRLAEAK